MKICNRCNEIVPEQANFCTNCGSADFRMEPYPTNQTPNNENRPMDSSFGNNVQPNYSYNVNSAAMNFNSPEYKKSKKKKEIAAGIIAAVVIIVCIAVIAIGYD